MQIFWKIINNNKAQLNLFNNDNQKFEKFVKILRKNKLHFIEKEYVVFYELDITTIYGLNNNIHKNKNYYALFCVYD